MVVCVCLSGDTKRKGLVMIMACLSDACQGSHAFIYHFFFCACPQSQSVTEKASHVRGCFVMTTHKKATINLGL